MPDGEEQAMERVADDMRREFEGLFDGATARHIVAETVRRLERFGFRVVPASSVPMQAMERARERVLKATNAGLSLPGDVMDIYEAALETESLRVVPASSVLPEPGLYDAASEFLDAYVSAERRIPADDLERLDDAEVALRVALVSHQHAGQTDREPGGSDSESAPVAWRDEFRVVTVFNDFEHFNGRTRQTLRDHTKKSLTYSTLEGAQGSADAMQRLHPEGSEVTIKRQVIEHRQVAEWTDVGTGVPAFGSTVDPEGDAPGGPLLDGVGLIEVERLRQVSEEGWSPEHDDAHVDQELARAAACYAMPGPFRDTGVPLAWPWESRWWKPTPGDRTGELVKAGALIAAEIDRLQRADREPSTGRQVGRPEED